MKKFINPKVLLILIVLLAGILRFNQISTNPPSLTWDETAWGYNAYSLGIDGKDEFGRFLPYDYLESFGDFKPPVYAYLDIIPVKIFGLNELAVRFPSALFGTLTILMTYFIVKQLFSKTSSGTTIALISAFMLAISPWHINLSRAAFEANVSSFLLITGVWLFLSGVQEKKSYLILSVLPFVLSIYTFNTARVVAPILVLGLAFGFRKILFERKKEVIIAIIVGLILILPIFKFLLSSQANLRFREVNIFSDVSIIKTLNQEVENDKNEAWSKIIHNRRLAFAVLYLEHYFDNFNPSFLFIKGDGNPKFSTQDIGQLYLWELPFLLVGILFLFKERKGSWWVIPLWLIIGVIPAATARETPHALRIETILPTFQILMAYGLITVYQKISNIKYQISIPTQSGSKLRIKYLIFTFCFLFFIFNFLYYLHGYYKQYPYEFSSEWQYGYKDSINYVKNVEANYDQINITDAFGRPYIYYLFYTKTGPDFFRNNALIHRDAFGFVTVKSFGKYDFGGDLNKIEAKGKKNLYINVPNQIPKNAKVLNNFYLLNGSKALSAYTI